MSVCRSQLYSSERQKNIRICHFRCLWPILSISEIVIKGLNVLYLCAYKLLRPKSLISLQIVILGLYWHKQMCTCSSPFWVFFIPFVRANLIEFLGLRFVSLFNNAYLCYVFFIVLDLRLIGCLTVGRQSSIFLRLPKLPKSSFRAQFYKQRVQA